MYYSKIGSRKQTNVHASNNIFDIEDIHVHDLMVPRSIATYVTAVYYM